MFRGFFMKKMVMVGFLAVLSSALLFAGGQGGSSGGGKQKTMRFSWWGGDDRHQATLKAIELYQQRNPGVKIEGEYGGWDGYYEKLVTQLAGGTAADILQVDQPWLYDLSSRGDMFMDIDGNSSIDISTFETAFLQNYCAYNGKIKGLPTGLAGETLMIDTRPLQAAGVDPNTDWSWDSLLSEGKKVNAANSRNYLIGFGPDTVRYVIFQKYLFQLAGGTIDADKKIMFTERQAEEVFTYIKRLLDEKVLLPFNESTLYDGKSEENPDWITGNIGMLHVWSSGFDKISAGKTSNLVVKPFPVLGNAKDSGIIVRPSQILAANNRSANKDEAAKFINFFLNDAEAAVILGTVRGIPSTTIARETLNQKGLLKPMVEEITNIALNTMGKPWTVWDNNTEIVDIMNDVLEKVGFGVLTPAQGAKELYDRVNSKLAAL
jgi:oligogalacturonide transport system substrate-binding protein